MIFQFWIIGGLLVGGLTGIGIGRDAGVASHIILGIIGGLGGGFLAALLFVVSGADNQANVIPVIIAYLSAVTLLAVKRVVIQLRTA